MFLDTMSNVVALFRNPKFEVVLGGSFPTLQPCVQAPGGTLDVALEGLLRGAASHVDPIVRRMCIQTLRRLLADIAAASQPPPGFQQCAPALCMARKHLLHIVSMLFDKRKLQSSKLPIMWC